MVSSLTSATESTLLAVVVEDLLQAQFGGLGMIRALGIIILIVLG